MAKELTVFNRSFRQKGNYGSRLLLPVSSDVSKGHWGPTTETESESCGEGSGEEGRPDCISERQKRFSTGLYTEWEVGGHRKYLSRNTPLCASLYLKSYSEAMRADESAQG